MIELVGAQAAWWCRYIGRIGALLGVVWPAGIGKGSDAEMAARVELTSTATAASALTLTVRAERNILSDKLRDAVADIEKLGKKKNRIGLGGNQEGFGLKLDASLAVKG